MEIKTTLKFHLIPVRIQTTAHAGMGTGKEESLLYWLGLCQLDTAGVIIEKGASVEEMPP